GAARTPRDRAAGPPPCVRPTPPMHMLTNVRPENVSRIGFPQQDEPTGGTVSYFAAAAVRGTDGWTAAEIDLSATADIEEVADLMRDVDADAQVSLLFVASDET